MRSSVAVLLLVPLLLAMMAGPAAADDGLEAETREIARLLKCPVCQNISVADSSSELAGQMRDLIRRKLEAGESREAILAYFVERYGETVLLDPPKSGFSGLIWWGAGAIPLLGLALVAVVLRRWSAPRASGARPAVDLSDEDLRHYEAQLERELERLDGRRA